MARIVLTSDTIVAQSLLRLTNSIIATKQQCDRLKAVCDQITNNGIQRGNLETSADAAFPVGTGAAIYDGIAQIQTALNGLSATVSAIDRGV